MDDSGICMPGTKINNSSILFDRPGVFHLRYIGQDTRVKDTTIFVNSRPNVSGQIFIDHSGEHAFDVAVKVSDPDDQEITCTLNSGQSIRDMPVHNSIAIGTLRGDLSGSINTQVSCTDGFETETTSQKTHVFPNQPPMIRNIPDISVEPDENSSIDVRYFGFDLENDTLTYSIVSQGNMDIADVNIISNELSVTGKVPGNSSVCLKANDGQADSNVQCSNVFVEDTMGSRFKNNEFSRTTVKLLMKIQYNNGSNNSSWEDEFEAVKKLNILPGAKEQIDLGRLFEWDSSTSGHPEGLFRVLFRAVDENNNTLLNRDGKEIVDSYNFTMVLFNTPPHISGIPDKIVFENEPIVNINLLEYAVDGEQNIEDLFYAIEKQANMELVNCSITNRYIISCIPAHNKTGISEINVSVFDGFAYDNDSFTIKIVPYEEFISSRNVTYTFISDIFDVSGDMRSGFRRISVNDTPPGRYNITFIVSYGSINVSKNITVTITLPETPILDQIGDRQTSENQTLSIQLTGYDPDGRNLTFGTDAFEKLPGVILFDEKSGSFEWTPGFDDSGNFTVTFNVTNGNFKASEAINISVFNTNRPPVLEPIPDIIVNESEPLFIVTKFTDPDNENSVANDDNELTVFINDTRFIKKGTNFTWFTGCQDAGNYTVIVTVADGYLTDSGEVNISVLDIASCQVFPMIVDNSPSGTGVPLYSVINITFNKEMKHTTVENSFSIRPNIKGIFNWTDWMMTFIPESLNHNTTYNVSINETAQDPEGIGIQQGFTWEFTTGESHINRLPVAYDQSVFTLENTPVNINITVSDPDDDILSYHIILPVNGTLTGIPPNMTYSPVPGFVGQDMFRFSVNDSMADSNLATVNITVDTSVPVRTEPTYSVKGYVFNDPGSGLAGVLVRNDSYNGSNNATTNVSGYYSITGLVNGTYNFSYSKSGFNTGYLEVSIRGADVANANMTIYDTLVPVIEGGGSDGSGGRHRRNRRRWSCHRRAI